MANEIYSSSWWGEGVCTNTIDWGVVYKDYAGCTPSFTNTFSLSFDGVDDYVDTNISSLTGTDFSISYWFKTTATLTNYNYYVPFSAVSNQQFTGAYLYYHPTTKLIVRSKNSSGTLVNGTIDLSDGNWHNIVVTYNSTSYALKMYVDGSIDYDETIFSFAVFNQPLLLGGKTSSQNLIDCSIDEASLFNSVLTPANVTSIYNSGIPNDLTSLNPTAWYRNGDNGTWKSPQWLIPNNENKTKFSNYSFSYDGVGDYIDLGSITFDATNGLTMSCWVKYDGVGAGPNWLCSNGNTGGVSTQFNTRLAANGAWYNYFQGGSNYTGILGLNDGNWHHIAQTVNYSNGDVKFYKDGVVSATIFTYGSTYSTAIVKQISTSFFPFKGQIDEFAVFESIENIADLYNGGVPSDLSSLSPVGYWRSEQSNFTDNWLVDNSALSNYSTRSFNFDGVDDKITFSSISASDEFTVSLWLKPTAFNNNSSSYVFGIHNNNSNFLKLTSATVVQVNIGSSFATLSNGGSGNDIVLNQWQNLIIIRNSSNAVLVYLNGVAWSTGATISSTLTINSIGRIINTSFGYNGSVDEFSFWQSDKTSDVATIYNSGTPTTLPSGVVAHWRMGEDATFNTNWNVPDQVGGNTGTSANMTISDLEGNAPNYTGGGLSANMTIEDRVGNAPNSLNNGLSYNQVEADRETDVPT